MSPFCRRRFAIADRRQGTPPRTRTLTNWVGTSRAANYTRDACCVVEQRKPWDSNPQTVYPVACFQDRFLIRPDDFRAFNQAPGVGIEPTASWFRARRHYQQQLPRNTSWTPLVRKGSGRGSRTPIAWFKARKRTVGPSPLVQSALRESNPPVQLGRLVPEPIGQGHVSSRRKERESNPQGREARPGSSGVPSPIGLPFHCIKAAAAGIEPASGRLTVAFPYQHRTHRIVSFSQDGRIRTGDLVRPRHAEYQAFPRPEPRAPSGSRTRTSAMARQQATATSWALGWKPNFQRSKGRSEHREGLEPSSPHYGCGILAAGRPVRWFSGTSGARTRTRLVKSQGCCR